MIFSSTSFAADGLKCFCAHIVDGVVLPPPGACHNNSCETSGVCLVELKFKDGHMIKGPACFSNVHGLLNVNLTCSIEEPLHVVKCCDGTDYCNENINITLPPVSTMTTSVPTTTMKPDREGMYAAHLRIEGTKQCSLHVHAHNYISELDMCHILCVENHLQS